MCKDLERELFRNVSPLESRFVFFYSKNMQKINKYLFLKINFHFFARSTAPFNKIELTDERANFQWFLSSLLVPLRRDFAPFKTSPFHQQTINDDSEMRLSIASMLIRLKVENDRKQMFSVIFEGPISNRGKVRLN